jgi:hypothetical protein
MPFESRLFVKTGIIYLVLTFVVGAGLMIFEASGKPVPFIIEVEHGHLGFVGWLVNVVIGVALWMFPLDRERFPGTQGRFPAFAPLWSYYLLNVGLAIRIFAEPALTLGDRTLPLSLLLDASALMQLAAILVFVSIVWTRTRGPGRPQVSKP